MSFFSKNLVYLRNKRNISRNELAEKIKVNQSTISRWENEDMGVTVDNAYDVANFFGISIADLTGLDLQEKKEKKFDELELLFDKAKPHLSEDDKETMKFLMQKTINNYEKSKNQE